MWSFPKKIENLHGTTELKESCGRFPINFRKITPWNTGTTKFEWVTPF